MSSLGFNFLQLQQRYAVLERSPFDKVATPASLAEACSLVDDVMKSFGNQLPISRNETVDDVNTGDLKFILLPYYAGYMYGQNTIGDRLPFVLKSEKQYKLFLDICARLQLYRPADVSDEVPDLATVRAAKVERTKAKRLIESRLKDVVQRQQRNKSDSEGLEDEEELEREHLITLIKLYIVKSEEELDSLARETHILIESAKMTDEEKENIRKTREEEFLQLKAAVLQEFVPKSLTKEEVIAGFFGPSHALPTYSIEEAGEVEMAIADRIKANAPPKKEEPNGETEEGRDYQTYKARYWDDWKDENPRGAGNTGRI